MDDADRVAVVLNLTRARLRRIREAVEAGGYDSAQDYVLTALENQQALEDAGVANPARLPTLDTYLASEAEDGADDASRDVPDAHQPPSITARLSKRTEDSIPTVELPQDERVGNEGPMWGGRNRILPVKVALRNLVGALAEADAETVPLGEFHEAASDVAREVGLLLAEIDGKRDRTKGDKLSPGFPTGDDPAKSKEWFRSQYAGYLTKAGQLIGAAPELRFVNILEGEPPGIGITPQGLEFVQIDNPVLDDDIESDRPLSSDEIDFYLEHVAAHLPGEHRAMVSVAEWIDQGVVRPQPLTDKVHTLDPDWSKGQANTMRSGLISRMCELGLVRRERVGQRGVGYALTDRGRELFREGRQQT